MTPARWSGAEPSDGALAIDLTDQIQQGVVVTHRGEIMHAGCRGAVAQREGRA